MLRSPVQAASPPREPKVARTGSPLGSRTSLLLLAACLAVTVVTVGAVVAVILAVPGARTMALSLLAATFPLHATLMLLTIHIGLRRAGTGWRALGFTRPTRRILHLVWQAPVLLLGLIVVQLIAFLIIGEDPVPANDGVDTLAALVGPVPGLLAFVGIAFLTPLWEEAIFRGIIHGGLRRRLQILPATILSGMVFAIAHGVPILLPYMLALGISLTLLREFHKTLWAPTIIHGLLNGLLSGSLLVATFN